MFKKDFVIMNQILCQKVNNLVGKDFYKLMNDSNFSYDCRNSIDNCTFAPISEELEEILYLKKSFWCVNVQICFVRTFRTRNKKQEFSFKNLIMKLRIDD